ncbi:MAG: chromosome partitioning protein ParB [Cycloclasticus sp. symbiont of Poecilosclerida sp. M]|nr:MAG: chromosome partitioning protein ParB [Cycloclasticus sp. symbiont of Poecilosclerida sp. M]
MSIKKRGLGRGLDALLSNKSSDVLPQANNTLAIEQLQRGKHQPRSDFDAGRMQELADSISAQGIIQPIVVRVIANNQYEILAGERRWRAAQMAGLKDVPVVIRDADDRSAIAISLIENIQREDLNPLDESEALLRLIDEFELTHQQAADAVGRSRAAVSNLLRLLELSENVKALLKEGQLEMGHGRALLALELSEQSEAALQVAKKGLSVRATEALVKTLLKAASQQQEPQNKTIDPDVQRLMLGLAEKLGAQVDIQHAPNGKGKIIIHYSTLDEMEGVLKHFK